ncbi:MAG: hypothetical protein LAO76_05105 [Acidobacteriia bacterium]|nr:hypothetical protein [Terriglobia bacterium]
MAQAVRSIKEREVEREHQNPEIKVLGDPGELILGSKPQEVLALLF